MLKNKLSGLLSGVLAIGVIILMNSCGTNRNMGCPMNFTQNNSSLQTDISNGRNYAANANLTPSPNRRMLIEK